MTPPWRLHFQECQPPASISWSSSHCLSLQKLQQKNASDFHQSNVCGPGRSLFSCFWDTKYLIPVDAVSTIIHNLVWPECITFYQRYLVRHWPIDCGTVPDALAGMVVRYMCGATICCSLSSSRASVRWGMLVTIDVICSPPASTFTWGFHEPER